MYKFLMKTPENAQPNPILSCTTEFTLPMPGTELRRIREMLVR